ncbi:hypothetical protein IK110_03525 [Candidatus Saccharibacteria bacterium]|nr:hypothetical protein [Candidatus Saccharibacteria bacterium]
MLDYISTPKGFKVSIGAQYVCVLGLSILLAWLATAKLVALDNKALVFLVAAVMFVIGVLASSSMNPKVVFGAQIVALVPIPTAIGVLLGGETLLKALMVLGAGLVIVTIIAALKPEFLDDKGSSFIATIVLVIVCDILAMVFKWLQFDLFRLILEFVLAALYADCWHKSIVSHPRKPIGLADSGALVFTAPISKITKLFSNLGDWLKAVKTLIGEKTSEKR